VLLANGIAWPAAYFWLSRWLTAYPLRVGLDPLIFLLASIATFAIALLVVSLGTVRAARANPVDSLRYE
jgi:putative ABC transport system permease protein